MFCFQLGTHAHDLVTTLIKCLCNIFNSLAYFTNYNFPWPFMHHFFSSCIFKCGKSRMRKGWILEKSTSIELKCNYIICVFLSPYNLGKLLLAEQLVHEQQQIYVVMSLIFLQGY